MLELLHLPPLDDEDLTAWAHHGVAAIGSDAFVTVNPAANRFLFIRGTTVSVGAQIKTHEAHGIAHSGAAGDPVAWIADPGGKMVPDGPGYTSSSAPGRVAAYDLTTGALLRELDASALPESAKPWRPTGVTVRGEWLWVSDGYGASYVHAFFQGTLRWSSDGSSTGAPFACPHDIQYAEVGGREVLLIADRGNRRICVFDLGGRFIEAYGDDYLTSPSGIAVHNGQIFVTELFGALAIIDSEGNLIDRVGVSPYASSTQWPSEPGWPNVSDGATVSAPASEPNVFRSAHGVAAGPDGTVVVTEWRVGGRVTVVSDPAA